MRRTATAPSQSVKKSGVVSARTFQSDDHRGVVSPSFHRPSQSRLGIVRGRRGGALLAVLWLCVALSAVAFTVATRVRGETERTSNLADGIRARYVAAGAIDRALNWMTWGPRGNPRSGQYSLLSPRMAFDFPAGRAIVQVIPETSFLSLNEGRFDDFSRLLIALGADLPRAQAIAQGVIQWRQGGRGGGPRYLPLGQSFQPRGASFQEVEEALYLQGMTPELFHGSYGRDAQGRLIPLGAFKNCVSVYGTEQRFDVNGIDPALMRAIGVPAEAAFKIVELRNARPIVDEGGMAPVRQLAGAGATRLGYNTGNTIYRVIATARLRRPDGGFSELRRTIAAHVKLRPEGWVEPWEILRWDENAESEVAAWQ